MGKLIQNKEKRGLRWNTAHFDIRDRRGRETAEKEWPESEGSQDRGRAGPGRCVRREWRSMPSGAEDAKTEALSVHWSTEQAPVRETVAGRRLTAEITAGRRGKEVEIMNTNVFTKPGVRVRGGRAISKWRCREILLKWKNRSHF